MIKGLFIVLEGIDGCGKTTIATKLSEWLFNYSKKIDSVVLTREPCNSKFGKELSERLKKKESPEEGKERLLELFVLDREYHVDTVIVPALNGKNIVICDRYKYSNMVYQSVQGIPFQRIVEENVIFPKPDLTLIFNVSSEEAMNRLSSSGKELVDKFEKQDFLEKVRVQYVQLPQLLPKEKFVIINANQSIELVFEDVKKVVKPLVDENS